MFIVIDGPDGSGKTTLAQSLTQQLCQRGFQTIYTSEPTNESEAGKAIHRILRGKEVTDVYTFADLFLLDRKEHIANFIEPCLHTSRWVVCDRYKYSALAYQQLQGISAEYLIEKNQDFLVPDIVFILLPKDVNILVSRIFQRGKATELFEKEELLTSTIPYYRNLKTYFPEENIHYLDANDSTKHNLIQILNKL